MKIRTKRVWKRGIALLCAVLMLVETVGCGTTQSEVPGTDPGTVVESADQQTEEDKQGSQGETQSDDQGAGNQTQQAGNQGSQETSQSGNQGSQGESQSGNQGSQGGTQIGSQEGLTSEIREMIDGWNEVKTTLDPESIGSNAAIFETFTKSAVYEYTLDPDDFKVSFILEEREDDSWTPFVSSKNTTFTVSDESVIEYVVEHKTIKFTAKKAGECIITATSGSKEATAAVFVLPLEDDRDSANGIAYYLGYIAQELEPLSDADRAEYLLNLADYAAVMQGGGMVDGNLMNAMGAACLLYPTTYLINNYASLLMSQQQYKEALTWLELAADAEPGNPVILTNLGECCYELGNLSMAMTYTDMAIAAEPEFGLAHLIQCCVYMKQGNLTESINSLFRSAKTCWTELTTDLMQDLYLYTKDTVERYDKFIITKDQLDLFMEAAGYGTTSDGRDILKYQISLPFPAPVTSAALTADESYGAASTAISEQNEAENGAAKYYEGYSRGDDPRHIFLAKFHILYYEFMIDQISGYKVYKEEKERLEQNFAEHERSTWAPVEEQLAEWAAEVQYHSDMVIAGMALALVDEAGGAMVAEHSKLLQEKMEKYRIEGLKLKIETTESLRDQWHTVLIHIEEAKMNGYETKMRPLLEEYYQRMNAILGYMTNDAARRNFERRVLYVINEEALEIPLSYAGADREYEVNKYDFDLEMLRYELGNMYSDRIKAQNQEVQARAEQAKLQEAQAQKQGWGDSFTLGLPPFSPIQVHVGMNEGNLTYGYSAFGHAIMYERDEGSGNTIQTISTTTSILPFGLGQLDSNIRGIRDFAGTVDFLGSNMSPKDIAKFAKGKVLGIPSFDATETTGTVNVYNSDGELIDTSRFRTRSATAGMGILQGSISTTETFGSRHQGMLTNAVNRATKVKIEFGGISTSTQIQNP